MLGEDIQNEHRSVDDLGIEAIFQGNQLTWGEFTIADDRVSSGGGDNIAQLGELSGSDIGARIGLLSPL